MDAMKDSGLKWIGTIPSDWKITRIKYMSSLKGRIGWQGLTSEEYQDEGAYLITGVDFLDGGIDWENCVHVPMKRWEEAKDIQIQNGDLLITKDGTIGKVAIVSDMPGETSLNSGVLRIMPFEGYSRRFLYWVLQSDEFWNWFNYKNAGNSTIVHLYQGDFAEFYYTFPDYDEQERIADYLDKHCAKLDKIIVNLERQIDLLQKYKKSLITETVTKGLDKNVEMKDSGIPWIKKIPKNWNVKRLKYEMLSYKAGPFGSSLITDELDTEGDVVVYSPENVANNTSDLDDNLFLPSYRYSEMSQFFIGVGEIVLPIVGTLGRAMEIVDGMKPGIINQRLAKFRLSEEIDNQYFIWLYARSDYCKAYLDVSSRGSIIVNLTKMIVGNIPMLIPPIDEQRLIVAFLKKKCNTIDTCIDDKTRQLELMQKHKASLIYEYVTGKKRVKEAV